MFQLIIFKQQREEKRKDFLENMLYTAKPHRGTVFRLKCDPQYNVSKTITKERKFYQLITTKRKVRHLFTII